MEKQPNSRYCFTCGRQNEIGLKMSFYSDNKNQQVIGHVTVPNSFNSYPGIVHGGIITAILDETSGRAVMLNGNIDNALTTTKIEVDFHRSTPCEEPLTAVGWVVEKSEKATKVAGELRRKDGTVTASSTTVLVNLPKKFLKGWEEEKKYWQVDQD